MGVQPYVGLVIEVVRRWHDHADSPVAEHRYRARLGDRIVADECDYGRLCARLDGQYARNGTAPRVAGADRQSRRYDWLK